MKKLIIIGLLLSFETLCFGQTNPSDINPKKITGKFIGHNSCQNNHPITHIHIKRGNRYKKRCITFGQILPEVSVGKWKIQNDTLVLIEKFYKKNAFTYMFTFGKRNNNNKGQARVQITKLIHQNGRWHEIGSNPHIFLASFTHYSRKGMIGYTPSYYEY